MTAPDSVVDLLQQLIKIPSINPDSCPDEDGIGEEACATFVGEFLELCGAEVTFETIAPGRPNVIGRFPNASSQKGLLFAPHLDTVSVKGMTIDPFAGEIRDGKIFGRGASDTKGTMAAMLWMFYQHRDEIGDLSLPVSFAGFVGEEAGQPGSIHFAKHHADEFAFAVIGEPTSLETVYAHKGCCWVALEAVGKSCHGSTPERGDNAILKLTRILEPLLARLSERLNDYEDTVLGKPTVSLGTIRGGSSTNIVPASCVAALDIRETPALQAARGSIPLIESILAEMDVGESITPRVIGESKPLLNDPDTDGIQRLRSIGSSLTIAPWFCDAGPLAEQGLPAVAVGPGDIAQAHTKDEFLTISDLEAGVDFYWRFLQTYR